MVVVLVLVVVVVVVVVVVIVVVKLLKLISTPRSSLPIHFVSCVRNVVRHFPSPG